MFVSFHLKEWTSDGEVALQSYAVPCRQDSLSTHSFLMAATTALV
jgi:hypothetical protein